MHGFTQALYFAAVTGFIIAAIAIALTDAFAEQQLEMETPQSVKQQNTKLKRRAKTETELDDLLPLLEKKSQSDSLLSMGFKVEHIECALSNTDGVEQALDFLIAETSASKDYLITEENPSFKISESNQDAPLKHLPSLVPSSFDPTDPNNWPELLRPSILIHSSNESATSILVNSLTTNITDHERYNEDEQITAILRPVSLVNDEKIKDFQKTVSFIEDYQEALPLIHEFKQTELLNGDLQDIDIVNGENFCACGCGIYDVEESESQNLETHLESPSQIAESNPYKFILQDRNAALKFSSEFDLQTGLESCNIVLPLNKQYDVAVSPSPHKLNLTAICDYENHIKEFHQSALAIEQNLQLANSALKKLQLATADCKFNDILYPENSDIFACSKSVGSEFNFPTSSSDIVFSRKPLVTTSYSIRSPSNLKIAELSANEMTLILSKMYAKDENESESLKKEKNIYTSLPENCIDMLSNTDLQCAQILDTLSSEVQDLNDDCELVLSYVPSPTFLKSRPAKKIAWECDEDLGSHILHYTFSSPAKVLVNYNGQCDPITSSVSEVVNSIDIEADAMAANAINEAVNSLNNENEADAMASNAINEAVNSINYENRADSINETVRSIIDTIINNSFNDGENDTDDTNPVNQFHYLNDYESVLLSAIKSKSNIVEDDKEANEFATKFEEISLNTKLDAPTLMIEDDLIRDDVSFISCMSELNDEWVVLD